MVFKDFGVRSVEDTVRRAIGRGTVSRRAVSSRLPSRLTTRPRGSDVSPRPAPVPRPLMFKRPLWRPSALRCPPGMTVYAAGTRSEKCIPITCKMGQELVDGVCVWKKLPGVTLPPLPSSLPPPPTQQPSPPTPLPITALPVPDAQPHPPLLPRIQLPFRPPPPTTMPLPYLPPLVQTPPSPKPPAASQAVPSAAPPALIETAEAMTKTQDVQIKKKSNIGIGAGAVIGLLIGGPIGAAAGAAAGALLTK